jgi:hypothetical protein
VRARMRIADAWAGTHAVSMTLVSGRGSASTALQRHGCADRTDRRVNTNGSRGRIGAGLASASPVCSV